MCTAVSFKTRDHYFGRNLDLEYALDEAVVVMPRRYPLDFRHMPQLNTHLSMIGTATVIDGQSLYYDATNETGLSIAALNFPQNAYYPPIKPSGINIAPFELIPFLLAQCSCVSQARVLLGRVTLAAIPFSEALPLTPLHFLISDKDESIVVEPIKDGLKIYDNPTGILTNNPPFDAQLAHLSRFAALSSCDPENHLDPLLNLSPCSRGTGAIGLPGDLTSASRFVRAVFHKAHSLCGDTSEESVTQFFHILASVAHTRGSVMVGDLPEITVYSSCCDTKRGIYYYTTYENSQISAIDMRKENLDGNALSVFPLIRRQQFLWLNR